MPLSIIEIMYFCILPLFPPSLIFFPFFQIIIWAQPMDQGPSGTLSEFLGVSLKDRENKLTQREQIDSGILFVLRSQKAAETEDGKEKGMLFICKIREWAGSSFRIQNRLPCISLHGDMVAKRTRAIGLLHKRWPTLLSHGPRKASTNAEWKCSNSNTPLYPLSCRSAGPTRVCPWSQEKSNWEGSVARFCSLFLSLSLFFFFF